jgi:hypothetical protein
LDLIESDSEESVQRLNRYLNYEAIQTGDAVTAIKNDYQRVVKQREIEERLPEVWSELVQEKNEFLLLAIMEKAKEKLGYGPTEKQVLTFLKNLSIPFVKPTSVPKIVHERPQQDKKKLTFKRLRVTLCDGEVIERKNGLDTFIEVIEKLGIERVKDLNLIRNTIPLISASKDPEREQRQLGQYYIVSHITTKDKKRTLDRIAKELEIDLEVELVDKV